MQCDVAQEEQDQFKVYRSDISENFVSICTFVQNDTLQYLYQLRSSSIETQATWQVVEALLFSIRSVAEAVDPYESSVVPAILSLFPRIPAHPFVTRMLLLTLGSFCDWLNVHPEQLPIVVPLVLDV